MRPWRSSRPSRRTPRGAEIAPLVVAAFVAAAGACDDTKRTAPLPNEASAHAATPLPSQALIDATPSFATFVDASDRKPTPSGRSDLPCRVIEGAGTLAHDGDAGAALPPGATIAKGQAVVLGEGGVATVKDPESGRELRFEGPARFVPCARTDEAWLLAGTLVVRPGSADVPLGELLVVVREGALRVPSGAAVRVSSTPEKTVVVTRSRRPEVWAARRATLVWASPDGGVDGGSETLGTLTLAKTDATAEAAATECAEKSKAQKALAAAMLERDASLSELSPKSIEASREERSACAVADARALAGRTKAPTNR